MLLVLTYKDTRPCWHCKWPLSMSVAFFESCEGPKVTLPPARASHPFSQMCLGEWVCLDVPWVYICIQVNSRVICFRVWIERVWEVEGRKEDM